MAIPYKDGEGKPRKRNIPYSNQKGGIREVKVKETPDGELISDKEEEVKE